MIKKILLVTAFAAMGAGCATQQTSNTQVASNVDEGTPYREPAAGCANGKDWTCKVARKNDLADQYMLDKKGNFYRYFKTGKQLCQITSNVKNFKISGHPADSAMVYFETLNPNDSRANGDLYVVHNQDTTYSGSCPKVSSKEIMANVQEYKIVPNRNTTIVNAALNGDGKFLAWDDVNVVFRQDGVVDFDMNTCFNQENKSYSSYVLFTLNHDGDVNKVKVGENFAFITDNSKLEHGSWKTLSEWKADLKREAKHDPKRDLCK